MAYPSMTPPNSPWAIRRPDVPGQREPAEQPVAPAQYAVNEDEQPTTVLVFDDPEASPKAEATQPIDLEAGRAPAAGDAETDPGAETDAVAGAPDPDPEAAAVADAVTEGAGPATDADADAGEEGEGEPAAVSAGSPISLWSAADAEALRARFAAVLPLFIDDPTEAVAQATGVVNDAVDALADALRTQHAALDPENGTGAPDTESQRVALRDYRDFLERILAL
ncbi:MAG: hypothetical protein HKP61_01790 [Dactylosporangium sp.]|nr:hypothetical protein [Dactylosporangium sp.]NNJ59695.1 hypothetical protein [Dactylosporangium sp.]